jgi:hypothetical protein
VSGPRQRLRTRRTRQLKPRERTNGYAVRSRGACHLLRAMQRVENQPRDHQFIRKRVHCKAILGVSQPEVPLVPSDASHVRGITGPARSPAFAMTRQEHPEYAHSRVVILMWTSPVCPNGLVPCRISAELGSTSPPWARSQTLVAAEPQRIAIATASIPPSRARTPHHPGTRRRETRRDFGPKPRPEAQVGRSRLWTRGAAETHPAAGRARDPFGTWAKTRKRRRGLSAAFRENQRAGCFRNRPSNSGRGVV